MLTQHNLVTGSCTRSNFKRFMCNAGEPRPALSDGKAYALDVRHNICINKPKWTSYFGELN